MRERLVQSYRQPQLGVADSAPARTRNGSSWRWYDRRFSLCYDADRQPTCKIDWISANELSPDNPIRRLRLRWSIRATIGCGSRYDCMRRVQKTIRRNRASHNRGFQRERRWNSFAFSTTRAMLSSQKGGSSLSSSE
jgi:hypothetical protein